MLQAAHAENDTGYRERMPSISSVINVRYLSLPWRYRWQKKMLDMCISLTSGYLTLQTEAVVL